MGLTRILVDMQLALTDFVDSYTRVRLIAMIVIISASTCSWLRSILPIFAYCGEDEVDCMFQEEQDDSEYATDRLYHGQSLGGIFTKRSIYISISCTICTLSELLVCLYLKSRSNRRYIDSIRSSRDVIALVRYAYSNDNTPDYDSDIVDDLRRLVTQYVGCEFKAFANTEQFCSLLEEGGPFVRDWWSLVRILYLKRSLSISVINAEMVILSNMPSSRQGIDEVFSRTYNHLKFSCRKMKWIVCSKRNLMIIHFNLLKKMQYIINTDEYC